MHDFIDPARGKAIPCGIYDLANYEGWVSVGDTADTAEFAVESIRRWWNQMGWARFPDADRLLINADAGGSNGYRLRAWKVHLAALAAETGLRITVCHYPPGTSKWNRIEHRMFQLHHRQVAGTTARQPAHHAGGRRGGCPIRSTHSALGE